MAAALTGQDMPQVTHQITVPSGSTTVCPDCKSVLYQWSHPKLQAAQEERAAGVNILASKRQLLHLQTGQRGKNYKDMIKTMICNSLSKRQDQLNSNRFSALEL